ncbi:hypothetical protein BJ508DRAFT_330890 [Ascobolus immersus RN42]|uniref:Uncharacterized protein n=1 Tax=Ascobolus immersus RN42 TaxID=1160509 RepID=A0A3N4HSF5_ASCIM|nr:hypothetical protein BJ508DRAFT_330890 [Ascobolus immersus RN42]
MPLKWNPQTELQLLRSIIDLTAPKLPRFELVADHFRTTVGVSEDEATTVAIRLKYYALLATPGKESFEKGSLVKGEVSKKRTAGAAGGDGKRKRGRPAKVKVAVKADTASGGSSEVKEEGEDDLESPY